MRTYLNQSFSYSVSMVSSFSFYVLSICPCKIILHLSCFQNDCYMWSFHIILMFFPCSFEIETSWYHVALVLVVEVTNLDAKTKNWCDQVSYLKQRMNFTSDNTCSFCNACELCIVLFSSVWFKLKIIKPLRCVLL